MKRIILAILAIALVVLIGFLIATYAKSPRQDLNWIPEQSRTARATITDEAITIQNVRNWTYSAEEPVSRDWEEVTVDPSTITRAWFLLEPFSDFKAIGHTFLSFEFADGRVLSFSIEALREQGEEYSALRGQFREYELSYQWGFERDFITRRVVYLDHPLRLYPLSLSPEESAALFRSLAAETNMLAEHPRFYNTLSANCTNMLAKMVNKHYPGTLPYDLSWNLTGLSDEYLMREGFIEMKGSVAETQAAYDLTPHRAAIKENMLRDDFSAYVRTLIPAPERAPGT